MTPPSSDRWASILRYDAAQRTSSSGALDDQRQSNTQIDRRQSTRLDSTSSTPSLGKRDASPLRAQVGREQEKNVGQADVDDAATSSLLHNRESLADVMPIPGALTGENGVLIKREMDRLRLSYSQAKQRHWRTFAGSAMLLNLGPTTYVFIQYIYAYLSLSPANWPLSKATDGTQASPDPLMWTLSLVNMTASAVAVSGTVLCGFYLRFSRRRSLATWMNWLVVMTSVTINLIQCIINLALIAIWNKKYSSSTISPYARTRNVANRCQGTWALDILWNAAQYSDISKMTDENVAGCPRNAASSLRNNLISGATRLVIFAVASAIWLKCLASYNRSLLLMESSNASIIESAEMRDLLLEEKEHGLPGMPTYRQSNTPPGAYRSLPLQTVDLLVESQSVAEQAPRAPSRKILPPHIDRFRWQRTTPSAAYEEEEDGENEEEEDGENEKQPQQQVHHHGKEVSAGGWSTGVVSHLLSAVWSSQDDHGGKSQSTARLHNLAEEEQSAMPEHHNGQTHERKATKLGVRGWFSRDISGQASEDLRNDEDDEEQLLSEYQHTRVSSQEKRAMQSRHAAARQEHEAVQADPVRSHEQYKRDQQNRIAFLAGLGYKAGQGKQPRKDDRESPDTARRSSQSAGDELPHMPEMMYSRLEEAIDDRASWPDNLPHHNQGRDQQAQPFYVRTLGMLVHKMSAIESEGCQERADQRSRSDRRSGSELY